MSLIIEATNVKCKRLFGKGYPRVNSYRGTSIHLYMTVSACKTIMLVKKRL